MYWIYKAKPLIYNRNVKEWELYKSWLYFKTFQAEAFWISKSSSRQLFAHSNEDKRISIQ